MEHEAELICVAREAALAQGWSLEDRIYSVRSHENGWTVTVDHAPNYTGKGEPSVTLDGSFFVEVNNDGDAIGITSFSGVIELSEPAVTRPR